MYNKLKILIIGYGSIGKRHDEVLQDFKHVEAIDIVTKQTIPNRVTYRKLEDVVDLQTYDYFIIASPTYKHYEQLKFLDKNVSDKMIFCEKPLFETKKDLEIVNNKVYIGYVLRFHPLFKELKNKIKDEKVLSVNINCGQYLPTWRADTNYRDSYSAKKEEGGGVLLDLSHEIDYLQWLFGQVIELKSYQTIISDLEISSDDLVTFVGITDKNTVVNLSIDYISKITNREMLIHTNENTYQLDFILNKMVQKNKAGLEQVCFFKDLQRNYMFKKMHQSILSEQKDVCTYDEGLRVMDTITKIQEQNK